MRSFHRWMSWGQGVDKHHVQAWPLTVHTTREIISLFITQAVLLKWHSWHCYAKEKEKFTFQDKMVLLVKQSYCLCNGSFNGRVQLEPGTCLQKCHVMGNDVECGKWCWRHWTWGETWDWNSEDAGATFLRAGGLNQALVNWENGLCKGHQRTGVMSSCRKGKWSSQSKDGRGPKREELAQHRWCP